MTIAQPFILLSDFFQHVVFLVLIGIVTLKLSVLWETAQLQFSHLAPHTRRTLTQERVYILIQVLVTIIAVFALSIGRYFADAFDMWWYSVLIWLSVGVMLWTFFPLVHILTVRVHTLFRLLAAVLLVSLIIDVVRHFGYAESTEILYALSCIVQTIALYIFTVTILLDIDIGTPAYNAGVLCRDGVCEYTVRHELPMMRHPYVNQ